MLYISGVVGSEAGVVNRIVYHEKTIKIADSERGGVVTSYPHRQLLDKLIGYTPQGDICVCYSPKTVKVYEYIESIELVGCLQSEGAIKFTKCRVELSGFYDSVVRVFDTIHGTNKYMTLFDFLVECMNLTGSYIFDKDLIVCLNQDQSHKSLLWSEEYCRIRFVKSNEAMAYFSKLFMMYRKR